MANIYDLANELEREIRVLSEYKKAQECRAAIDADEEAKALFKEFTEFQQGLYAKLQSVKCLQVMNKLKCKNWVLKSKQILFLKLILVLNNHCQFM